LVKLEVKLLSLDVTISLHCDLKKSKHGYRYKSNSSESFS